LQKGNSEGLKKKLDLERQRAEEFDKLVTDYETAKFTIKQMEIEMKKLKEDVM